MGQKGKGGARGGQVDNGVFRENLEGKTGARGHLKSS